MSSSINTLTSIFNSQLTNVNSTMEIIKEIQSHQLSSSKKQVFLSKKTSNEGYHSDCSKERKEASTGKCSKQSSSDSNSSSVPSSEEGEGATGREGDDKAICDYNNCNDHDNNDNNDKKVNGIISLIQSNPKLYEKIVIINKIKESITEINKEISLLHRSKLEKKDKVDDLRGLIKRIASEDSFNRFSRLYSSENENGISCFKKNQGSESYFMCNSNESNQFNDNHFNMCKTYWLQTFDLENKECLL